MRERRCSCILLGPMGPSGAAARMCRLSPRPARQSWQALHAAHAKGAHCSVKRWLAVFHLAGDEWLYTIAATGHSSLQCFTPHQQPHCKTSASPHTTALHVCKGHNEACCTSSAQHSPSTACSPALGHSHPASCCHRQHLGYLLPRSKPMALTQLSSSMVCLPSCCPLHSTSRRHRHHGTLAACRLGAHAMHLPAPEQPSPSRCVPPAPCVDLWEA